MDPGVNTLLTSSSMYNKCKFSLMILDSDLGNAWYVTAEGTPFLELCLPIKCEY